MRTAAGPRCGRYSRSEWYVIIRVGARKFRANTSSDPRTSLPPGTKVPGTNYQLDPIRGAFNIGTMIRWLDFNDCWLAAECASLSPKRVSCLRY